MVVEDRQKEVDKIINSIIINDKENWEGDSAVANRHFDSYTKRICKLLYEGYSEILEVLIEHEEPSVQAVGAYFLLPIETRRAKKKLKYLFNVRGSFVATNSRSILNEWGKIISIFPKLERRLTFPRLVDNKVVYLRTNDLKNVDVNI